MFLLVLVAIIMVIHSPSAKGIQERIAFVISPKTGNTQQSTQVRALSTTTRTVVLQVGELAAD